MSYNLTYPHFFEPNYFLLTGLPLILRTIFMLIVNYYILRASKNQPEGIRRCKYLKWCATINFVFLLIVLTLPVLRIVPQTLSQEDLFIISIFYFLKGLIISIPFLISYGILIFLFARKNRSILGVYLYTSGIFFMIGYSLFTIYLGGYLSSILFLWDIGRELSVILFGNIDMIISIINLLGFIFLLIHGINEGDSNFKMAGIVFFIGFGITLTYGLIIPFYVSF
jgi:hypothetical protein